MLRAHENNELREFYVDGYVARNPEGEGFVIGANKSALDRILLRHELYHIFRDETFMSNAGRNREEDIEKIKKDGAAKELGPLRFVCIFEMEPKADIYSVTGLRF